MVIEVFTDQWISQEFKKIYKKSQFKEQGATLGLVHPLICDYLSIKRSIRKANILKQSKILTGVGYHKIVELGRILYELKDIINIEKLRSRLQGASEYLDVLWELQVALVLKYSGFEVAFIEEGSMKSYDILASRNGLQLPIECKNRKADHRQYQKVASVCASIYKSVLEQMDQVSSRGNIRITLLKLVSLSESKHIKSKVKGLLDRGLTEIRTDDYIIEIVPEYEHLPTSLIMEEHGEEAAYCSAECEIQEAYSKERVTENNYNNRVFFRFSPPNEYDVSVVSLLEKANRQFRENDTAGCIFLRVPYSSFTEACDEVEDLLKRTYSSVGAVKVVGLMNDFSPVHGVVTGRYERLVVNERSFYLLNDELINALSENIMFNIYK